MSQGDSSIYLITDHARMRLRERFIHVSDSLETYLCDAIVFGGQLNNEYLLYNDAQRMVFPVVVDDNGNHVIKTVLTLEQCYANLSSRRENRRMILPTDPTVKERVEINRAMAVSETVNIKLPMTSEALENTSAHLLKALAEQYIERFSHQYPVKAERVLVNEEIKRTHSVSNRMLEKYFWAEIGRLVYEHNRNRGYLPS
jgi:hypothetical protein